MILDKIVEHKKLEVEQQKQEVSLAELKQKIETLEHTRDFKGALEAEGMSLIAEIKKASPSKGVIREDFNPIAIAKEYQQAGAKALSVLTDEKFFQGKLDYLTGVKAEVDLPLLRKDFIIDPYQIYQARACGADAILLIVAILSKEQLKDYLALAKSLGLGVLVEVHNRKELTLVLQEDCDIIGINNRDLRVFEVDLATTLGLKRSIPKDKVVISESGIKNRNDVELLADHGIDGILVGEALMRSTNISTKIGELVG
ncbi:indole-3-glycerol phosphate synthase [Orenia metallireducens]|uniref:Indole-3-glycerol phosphate synthase n=1 Tax=Orenia metallireducens TaxID=1413210 RepID=A0A285HA84_9FIRM|nr:indole-3-glycerol phosphate synthase TrpC [Orenia metallireducens]PRX28937.1 indole-3-glycerol phosphate synthase [Orenia metallireducens]SNY32638.1 indole-3-glycerol phosphate synthase [Orenia metallireducens]